MLRRAVSFVFTIAVLVLAVGIALPGARQSHAEEPDGLLAKGKEIFLERCARCHNENGDKPLKTGAPLNQRALSTEEIAQAINGRLRDGTEDERLAVTLYISSLMQNKEPETKTKIHLSR